jgi:hypothetical protein
MILMASWETMLGQVGVRNSPAMLADRRIRTSIIGLINGGTAGMIWLYLVAWIGFLAVNTSMAEMASMYVDTNASLKVRFIDRLSGHRLPEDSIIGSCHSS